MEQKKTRV